MSFFSWFSKKSTSEDYEQVLASLALSIQRRQTRLSEIRLRERRATLLVTTWAFSAWVAYVGLWWAGLIGRRVQGRSSVLWGMPVVVGPVVILFTRRIVQLWYTRIGNAEEKTLKELLVQQRNKIEEIKKKTNYYTTRNLLERYDNSVGSRAGTGSSSPNPQRRPLPTQTQPQVQSRTPLNVSTASGQEQPSQLAPTLGLPQAQSVSPTIPLQAPRKQWYDKLADALLGDDTASIGPSPASRYALICERCFSHNGLVKEEQWEDAQYLCPKCGHFNRSARSRKAGMTSPTATPSDLSPSSVPLPQTAVSEGWPVAPASSQPAQGDSSVEHPSSSQFVQSSASAGVRDSPPKSPLSASTVLVDNPDVDGNVDGHDAHEVGRSEDNRSMQMDVDS